MNTLRVIKFGGTSLMTIERIKQAAQIIADTKAHVRNIVVVVSAMGHTTDQLIGHAEEIALHADKRELDALLATGEQMSASLMAMALQNLGLKARSFSGCQAGISTNDQFGNAAIIQMHTEALTSYVNTGIVPVVAGFQGATAAGDLTTLGRGGSDTSAIALAAALKAERCDIYSDVDGIYSADPRLVESAFRLESISVLEMLELAKNGAQVLNSRSVEWARDYRVPVRVRSTFKPEDEGTLVACKTKSTRNFTGVALNNDVNCIEVHLEKLELDSDRKLRGLGKRRTQTRSNLLKLLADSGINAEIMSQMKPNPFRILLAVKKADTMAGLNILSSTIYSVKELKVHTDVACVTVVAKVVTASHNARAADALEELAIPIKARAWHFQRLTIVVPASSGKEALRAIHRRFAEAKGNVVQEMKVH